MICHFHEKPTIEYFKFKREFVHKNISRRKKFEWRKFNLFCLERYQEVVWLRNNEQKRYPQMYEHRAEIIHNHIIQIWLTTNTLVNDVIPVMMVFPFMITAFPLHTSLQFAIWQTWLSDYWCRWKHTCFTIYTRHILCFNLFYSIFEISLFFFYFFYSWLYSYRYYHYIVVREHLKTWLTVERHQLFVDRFLQANLHLNDLLQLKRKTLNENSLIIYFLIHNGIIIEFDLVEKHGWKCYIWMKC